MKHTKKQLISSVSEKILAALSVILIAATLIPYLSFEHWIVRIFDFPRLQILFLSIVVLGCLLYFVRKQSFLKKILLPVLLFTIAFQVYNILPYTPLVAKSVPKSLLQDDKNAVSVMVANVYMKNHKHQKLINLVQKYKPDVLITLETNQLWQQALRPLEQEYPYSVKIPKENTYGMHLYSKLPLQDTEVKYWLDKDVPSVKTIIRLRNGQDVLLYALHPKPPVPTEQENSKLRDAEIIIVANRVAKSEQPVIVAGDFNDVAWSATTQLFQDVSGMYDPRIGRGMFNTYNAKNPLLRWPLDHIFHSGQFQVIRIERLPSIHSDHFPIYIDLKYDKKTAQTPEKPDEETREKETQTIEEGIEEARERDK